MHRPQPREHREHTRAVVVVEEASADVEVDHDLEGALIGDQEERLRHERVHRDPAAPRPRPGDARGGSVAPNDGRPVGVDHHSDGPVQTTAQLGLAEQRRGALPEGEQVEAAVRLGDRDPLSPTARVGLGVGLDADDVDVDAGDRIIGEGCVGQEHAGEQLGSLGSVHRLVLVAPGRDQGDDQNKQERREAARHRWLNQ